ncbi:hypothetical protein ACFPYJ_04120 [Paenibacillus solisilvae]|uniref:DUF4362 domain-containing protein n=1 Tax=Paenibacillus solisilvae TaxID=2486751 RepID=A0ABW0VW75_9BACL
MKQTNTTTRKKRTLTLVMSLVVVVSLTAAGCGNNDTNSNANTSNNVDGKVYNEDAGAANGESGSVNNNAGVTDPDVPDPAPVEPKPAEPDDKTSTDKEKDPVTETEKQGKGTYIGQADTNSIEIKTSDGTSTVYQIDDKMFEKVNQLEENTPVTYTYMEKEISGEKIKQLWLTSIKAT